MKEIKEAYNPKSSLKQKLFIGVKNGYNVNFELKLEPVTYFGKETVEAQLKNLLWVLAKQ